ncbi:MAG: hypothetical protein IT428_24805 [Planctomycetaceae bacterium]|nr:hypothetical protein [Planctomycetaceae bacterium]
MKTSGPQHELKSNAYRLRRCLMHETFHVIALVVLPLAALALLAISRKKAVLRGRQRWWAVAVIGFVGIASQFTLNMNGAPFLEWSLPLIVVVVWAIFGQSDSMFRAVAAGMFVVAIGLSASFLSLVASGYTTRPDRLARLYDTKTSVRVKGVASQLKEKLPSDKVIEQCPVGFLLASKDDERVTQVEFRERWHTPVTGLRQIVLIPASIWYVGGVWKDAERSLEVRVDPRDAVP